MQKKKKKRLNLSKNSELCGILICPIPIFTSSKLHDNLENQNPVTTVKTRSLIALWRGRMGLERLQSLILRELSLFELLGGSLEDRHSRLSLFDLTQSFPHANSLFPGGISLK